MISRKIYKWKLMYNWCIWAIYYYKDIFNIFNSLIILLHTVYYIITKFLYIFFFFLTVMSLKWKFCVLIIGSCSVKWSTIVFIATGWRNERSISRNNFKVKQYSTRTILDFRGAWRNGSVGSLDARTYRHFLQFRNNWKGLGRSFRGSRTWSRSYRAVALEESLQLTHESSFWCSFNDFRVANSGHVISPAT